MAHDNLGNSVQGHVVFAAALYSQKEMSVRFCCYYIKDGEVTIPKLVLTDVNWDGRFACLETLCDCLGQRGMGGGVSLV